MEKLKRHWSSYGFRTARNQVISAKQLFPAHFFKEAADKVAAKVDFNKLKRLKTTIEGPTASVIYYGKVFQTDNESSLAAFHFVQEESRWKVDRVHQRDLSQEQVRKLLTGKDASLLKDKDLLPSGVIPPLPPEYPMPVYMGSLKVVSFGYKTTVKFNAESQSFNGGSGGGLMIGGLKRGTNTIVIKAEPLPEKPNTTETRKLEVTIYAGTTMEELYIYRLEVFSFKPESLNGEVTKEFEISDKAMAKSLAEARRREDI